MNISDGVELEPRFCFLPSSVPDPAALDSLAYLGPLIQRSRSEDWCRHLTPSSAFGRDSPCHSPSILNQMRLTTEAKLLASRPVKGVGNTL